MTAELDWVSDVIERWRRAELGGDCEALHVLLAEDFIGVGPMGWQRSKSQWIDKYRTGTVRNDRFDLTAVQIVRVGADGAVVVAHQQQQGANGGRDTTGEFRFSIVVSKGEGITLLHATRIISPG